MEMNYQKVVGYEFCEGSKEGQTYKYINLYLASKVERSGACKDGYGVKVSALRIYSLDYNKNPNPVFIEAQKLKEGDLVCPYFPQGSKNCSGLIIKEK